MSAGASRWLFSPALDLGVFLGSALLSLGALLLGAYTGVLHDETPEWAWVPAILLIDVAHVYSTGFRVYFDRGEWSRRPWLYTLVPILGFLGGVTLYSEDVLLFWRVLAYLAVFHFVRQQYGFMVLYRARAKETGRLGYWIDTLAIYAATLYPLLYWHAHLPRQFWWFLPGDFLPLPSFLDTFFAPLYWGSMAAYALRSAWCHLKGKGSWGKDILLLTTAVCWYVGIKTFNSDYAFTVTNVFIHGIPYLALVYWFGKRYQAEGGAGFLRWVFRRGFWLFLALLWTLAYFEELLWDRAIWHERSWLFGGAWEVGVWEVVLVPLFALPQMTHYILDGFIWKRRQNPGVAEALGGP